MSNPIQYVVMLANHPHALADEKGLLKFTDIDEAEKEASRFGGVVKTVDELVDILAKRLVEMRNP